MKKIKIALILSLSIVLISFLNKEIKIEKENPFEVSTISKSINLTSYKGFNEVSFNGEGNEESPKTIEEIKTVLEELIEDLRVLLDTLKEDKGIPKEELPYGHRYISKAKTDNLKQLIANAEDLIDNEEVTFEALNQAYDDLIEAEEDINQNMIIGEKEDDYRSLILIIGSSLGFLAVIGTITIFVLARKNK